MSSSMIKPPSAKAPSFDSLDTLITLMSEISHAMGRLSADMQALVRQDLAALRKLTEKTHSQQVWKGGEVVLLTAFSGTLAIIGDLALSEAFGSLLPEGIAAYLTPPGMDDDEVRTFWSSTAKTIVRCIEGGVVPANDARHNAQLSTLQSNRELVKMCLDQEQGAESGYDALVRKLHEMASGILQSAR